MKVAHFVKNGRKATKNFMAFYFFKFCVFFFLEKWDKLKIGFYLKKYCFVFYFCIPCAYECSVRLVGRLTERNFDYDFFVDTIKRTGITNFCGTSTYYIPLLLWAQAQLTQTDEMKWNKISIKCFTYKQESKTHAHTAAI